MDGQSNEESDRAVKRGGLVVPTPPPPASPLHAFTPATDTAVTDQAAVASPTLRLPHIQPRGHSIREEASSSSMVLPGPELASKDTQPLGTLSTPPTTPTSTSTKKSVVSLDADTGARIQTRTYTPPSSPTQRSHSKSSSLSSSSIKELETRRRGMSPSAQPIEEIEKPGSAEPRQFPIWDSDYDIDVDAAGTQKVLGMGLWSTVYLASPAPSMPRNPSSPSDAEVSQITPPLTPTRSRSKSSPPPPSAYAVKVPHERTANKVLAEEGRILSYLSRFPSAEKYVVPYYGQDTRSDALIMAYMPQTLDDFIAKDLNTRDEQDRAALLAARFPPIATNLVDGLAWLHDKACVHGDIKPANILLTAHPNTHAPHAVFADFTASTIAPTASSSSSSAKEKAPRGGATWDYMAPSQLTSHGAAAPPTPESDLWSLAMTLLQLVTGASPYRGIEASAILKRELMKQGTPLAYVAHGEHGVRSVRRLGALSRALGFNVKRFFQGVLVRDEERRVGVKEWRGELGRALT